MSNAPAKKLIGYVDPGTVEAPGQGNGDFILKYPGPDKPLIVKCVLNPDLGRAGFLPMKEFPHQIGPGEKDVRFHPCRTFFGDKASPEAEALKTAYEEKDRLKKDGKSDESPEVLKQLAIIKQFKERKAGWLFVIEPGSPKVKALKIGPGIINTLFGRKGFNNVKEIPSLVRDLQSKGYNPYDLQKNEGWLMIWKTGEGLGTEYVIKLAESEVDVEVGGRKLKAMSPQSYEVHEKIKDLTTDDLPSPVKFEERNAFTSEEAREFVKSMGTKVPERYLKGSVQTEVGSGQTGGPARLVDASVPTTAVGLDDVPW